MRLHTVNRAFWLLIVCVGCQVGRPPPSAGPFKVHQVIASSAEPGLKDALKAGLGQALTARGVLDAGGQAINVAVLRADASPAAVGPNSQMYTARLQVSVQVGSRSAQFSSERSYSVIDPVQGAAARAAAFEALAQQLMRDGVMWLSNAPQESKP